MSLPKDWVSLGSIGSTVTPFLEGRTSLGMLEIVELL